MENSPAGVQVVCCGVLKQEVELLQKNILKSLETPIFIGSMLHMYPKKLEDCLKQVLSKKNVLNKKVLIIYGDCCPKMGAFSDNKRVFRTKCNNCCDLLLGSSEYRRLAHEGVFFLLPEWAKRWKEIFSDHLGLNQQNAIEFMGEMHSKLMYLDTGIIPIPEKELKDCSIYCGLPFVVKKISLNELQKSIEETYKMLNNGCF